MFTSTDEQSSTSVHNWKPCPPERFTKLLHEYTSHKGDGVEENLLTSASRKLDEATTSTMWHRMSPDKTPDSVLMTISMYDGKVICFERIQRSAVVISSNSIEIGSKSGSMVMSANGDISFTGALAAKTQTNSITAVNTSIGTLSSRVSDLENARDNEAKYGKLPYLNNPKIESYRYPPNGEVIEKRGCNIEWEWDHPNSIFDGFVAEIKVKPHHTTDSKAKLSVPKSEHVYLPKDARSFRCERAVELGKSTEVYVYAYRINADGSTTKSGPTGTMLG